MSSEFVRYAPEIETIDPHFDELLAHIDATGCVGIEG